MAGFSDQHDAPGRELLGNGEAEREGGARILDLHAAEDGMSAAFNLERKRRIVERHQGIRFIRLDHAHET